MRIWSVRLQANQVKPLLFKGYFGPAKAGHSSTTLPNQTFENRQ
jgi:hypothetical protein